MNQGGVQLKLWIKLPNIWNMQPDDIIVKYCAEILINWEEIISMDLTQLNIGIRPKLVIKKELKRDEQKFWDYAKPW